MLSEVTILTLAVTMPFISIFCFIKGYNIGAKESKKPEIKVETPKEKREKRKISKEAEIKRKRMTNLLANIEAYDGSSKGQREFE